MTDTGRISALLAAVVFLLPSPLLHSEEAPQAHSLEFFSDEGRAFAPLKADPREAQFRLGAMLDDDGSIFEDLVMGADLGFMLIRLPGEALVSLTGRGLLTARFNFTSDSFDLQNSDFIGGPALSVAFSNWSLDLWASHQSSHLGDELMESGDRQRIDVGYERIRLLGDFHVGGFRAYGGCGVIVHAYPSSLQGRTVVQGGAEFLHPVWGRPLFAALDAQGIVNDRSLGGLTLQTGIELGRPLEGRNRQRAFVEYFQGYSSMGQFFDEPERHGLVGIAYVFR